MAEREMSGARKVVAGHEPRHRPVSKIQCEAELRNFGAQVSTIMHQAAKRSWRKVIRSEPFLFRFKLIHLELRD